FRHGNDERPVYLIFPRARFRCAEQEHDENETKTIWSAGALACVRSWLPQGRVPKVLRAQPRAPPPHRAKRVGDPGGGAPWVPKGLAGDFRQSESETSRTDAAKTPQVWSEARTSGEADLRAEPPASGAER